LGKGKHQLRRFLLRPVIPPFRETVSLQLPFTARTPDSLMLLSGQFTASRVAGPVQVFLSSSCPLPVFLLQVPFHPSEPEGLQNNGVRQQSLAAGFFFFPGPLANSPTDL